MKSIRIRNLRCLADTGTVELKPITLLVGANSSGKSSFLRVFPLLRQSAETSTASGLLINEGDVNFGFFPEAVHKDASPPELGLTFELMLDQGIYQGRRLNSFLLGPMSATAELTYAKRTNDFRYPYLREVRLTLNGAPASDEIVVTADEEGQVTKFSVNSFVANGEVGQLRLRLGRRLVPTIVRSIADKGSDASVVAEEAAESDLFERQLLRISDALFHGNTTKITRLDTLRGIRIGTPEQMLAHVKEHSGTPYWRQSVRPWTVDSKPFLELRNIIIAKATSDLLSSVNLDVSQFAASTQYFQPVRAFVERDYLSRDVRVDSVDPRGLNVAMVLASLPSSVLSEFRVWTKQFFGFEVYPKGVGDGARIALHMKEATRHAEFNLADMGFGFSQMLPFLVQIWKTLIYDSKRLRHPKELKLAIPREFVVAIEQPELHLHPALQAKLADFFASVIRLSKDQKLPIRFILETHSPTIIERIGYLVSERQLSQDDVQVLLFERSEEAGRSPTTTIRLSTYDSDGVLQDWPFGFLSAPLGSPANPVQ